MSIFGTHPSRSWLSSAVLLLLFPLWTQKLSGWNRDAPDPAGHDYYVSPNGNDAHDGSRSYPWASIQHAAGKVRPGATVHVAPGTYHEDILMNANGTADRRIRFVSDERWAARIIGVAAPVVWQIGNGNTLHNGNYLDIVGFEIVGSPNALRGISSYGHHNRLLSNKVHDVPSPASAVRCSPNGGAGMEITWNGVSPSDQTDNEVDGNYVYNIGGYPAFCNTIHGIYISTPGNRITNNVVFRTAAYGIHVYHNVAREIITGNTIFDCNKAGIIISSDGSLVDDFTTVSHNTVINNGRDRVHADGGIREISYPGGFIGRHNVYSGNIVYGNRPTNFDLCCSAPDEPIMLTKDSPALTEITARIRGYLELLQEPELSPPRLRRQ